MGRATEALTRHPFAVRLFVLAASIAVCAHATARAKGPATRPAAASVFLADLAEAEVDCWTDPAVRMVFHKRTSDWKGSPIKVNGKASANGLFTHPPERGKAVVRYALDGGYSSFRGEVGIADGNDPPPQSAVTFKLVGDDKLLWTSRPIQGKGRTVECEVDISGVSRLELVAEAAGSHYFAHAVWLEPQVRRTPPPATRSAPVAGKAKTPRAAKVAKAEPRFERVIYIVDCSGSTLTVSGHAKAFVRERIEHPPAGLQEFGVIGTSDQAVTPFGDSSLVPVNGPNNAKAIRFLDGLAVGGRADLGRALNAALATVAQRVEVVTDGDFGAQERDSLRRAVDRLTDDVRDKVVVRIVSVGTDGEPSTRDVSLADAVPPTYGENVTDDAVADRRRDLIGDLDRKIAAATGELQSLPNNSKKRKQLADAIRTLRDERQKAQRMADWELAEAMLAEKQAPKRTAAASASGRRRRDADYNRDAGKPGPASKYPDWEGPWARCPACRGTGHTEESREETQQNISPDLGQIAGSGMSGRLTNAIAYCDACGGTGSIPGSGGD